MLNQIVDLFFKQEVFSIFPKPQITAYFKSIIEDEQIVTIERNGKIIAFQDYWKINLKLRDIMLKMTREEMGILFIWGSYPHCPEGKHIYVNFTVVDKEYTDSFVTIELARKIAEKNPDNKTVVYHRIDNKSYLSKLPSIKEKR